MSGPAGAGAGAPNTYRPPTEAEQAEMDKLFISHTLGPDLRAKDADRMLKWLRSHPDVAVDWLAPHSSKKFVFFSRVNHTFLGAAFLEPGIPAEHPLIDEVVCRSTNFTLAEHYGDTILGRLKQKLDFLKQGYDSEMPKHWKESLQKKYELATNPEALRERCNRKFMRQGVKDVANLQKASKAGLPLPEGPMSIVTGLLTGKPGDTSQQMTAAREELGRPKPQKQAPPPVAEPTTARRSSRLGAKGGPTGGRRTRRTTRNTSRKQGARR